MPDIKKQIERRTDNNELTEKRKIFTSGVPDVIVDKIFISGLNSKQAEYVRRIIKPGDAPVPLSQP